MLFEKVSKENRLRDTNVWLNVVIWVLRTGRLIL